LSLICGFAIDFICYATVRRLFLFFVLLPILNRQLSVLLYVLLQIFLSTSASSSFPSRFLMSFSFPVLPLVCVSSSSIHFAFKSCFQPYPFFLLVVLSLPLFQLHVRSLSSSLSPSRSLSFISLAPCFFSQPVFRPPHFSCSSLGFDPTTQPTFAPHPASISTTKFKWNEGQWERA